MHRDVYHSTYRQSTHIMTEKRNAETRNRFEKEGERKRTIKGVGKGKKKKIKEKKAQN